MSGSYSGHIKFLVVRTQRVTGSKDTGSYRYSGHMRFLVVRTKGVTGSQDTGSY